MSTLKLSLVGLGARVILLVINVISVVLLARYLEPQGRGEYFLFQTLVSVLSVVGDCGLSQSANVFVGRSAHRKKLIHAFVSKAAIILWIGMSGIGGLVLWMAGEQLLHDFPARWQWAAFAILPCMLYAGFWNSLMIGLGEIALLNGVQLVIGPVQLVLILALVVGLSGGVTSAVTIYLCTMLLQCVLMVRLSRRLGFLGGSEHVEAGLSRQMLAFGLRAYPNAIATMGWMRIPVFVLNAFHGAASVGIFSVAQQLAERALMPIQAAQDAIYGKMSALSPREAIAAMNRYIRIVVSGMVASTVGAMLLAPWIVMALFGPSYQPAVYVFWILLVGVVFVSVSMIVSTYVLGQRGRPGLLSLLAGANACICLASSYWLIPTWAEMGAAMALALTQAVGAVVVFGLYWITSSATLRETLLLTSEDVTSVLKQLGKLTWRKGTQS
ncbi:MAG TPA: oligosaccharide flippase family protein [Nitrospira sp.]|nr:oligosaccharide flippase family protein [Nitrospira sp.]